MSVSHSPIKIDFNSCFPNAVHYTYIIDKIEILIRKSQKNSKFLYTSKNSFLYDDCLLTDK